MKIGESVESKSQPEHSYWRVPGESPNIYKWLGVKVFKELCPTTNRWVRKKTGLGAMPPGNTLVARINSLIENTKLNEGVHLGAAALTGVLEYTGVMPGSTAAVLAYQVPVNVYPIMLQRYNRLTAYAKLDEIQAQADQLELTSLQE